MRTDYIAPDTMRLLTRNMSELTALPVLVALETGMRIGDVVSLTMKNLKGCNIYYKAQKTGKRGKADISPDLLSRILRITDGYFLFPSKYKPGTHVTRQAVWAALKREAKMNGIEKNVAPHSARKTFAVEEMKQHGIGAVQQKLQHSDTSTTLLYCLSDPELLNSSKDTNEALLMIATKLEFLISLTEKFATMLLGDTWSDVKKE